MFSSKDYLARKTSADGVDRLSYLQALVTEFQDTDDLDAKQQVLANLGNFAYDPMNYGFFRQLNVLDLFLDSLEEQDDKLVEFGLGGLCNCCLDPENNEYITKNGGIPLIIKCLSSPNEETVLNAVTTLQFILTEQSRDEVTSLPVVECMLRFAKCPNVRLRNLASIFLEECCRPKRIEEGIKFQQEMMTKHQTSTTPAGEPVFDRG